MQRLRATRLAISVSLWALAVATPVWADQPEDAWITTKVKMALLTDEYVNALDINVDTTDGKVTLHGEASTEDEKARAARRAGEIAGVGDVRNLIAVIPDEAREATSVADEALAQDVKAALAADRALQASDVDVKSVNDGVVVVAGNAETLSAHHRALETAREVDGVRQVASEIESPDELGDAELWEGNDPSDTANDVERYVSDAWLTTKSKMQLMTETGLSPLAISVDTSAGVVTLFGIVEAEETKQRAAATVAQLDGVKDVENYLQVVPDVAAERIAKTDEDLEKAISERVAARESLGDASIDVEVKNRVAHVTGTVQSQRDRLTVLTLARTTDGIDSVVDGLDLETPES